MYRNKFIDNISRKKISIYDKINVNDAKLWIPTDELEKIFNKNLIGFSLNGLALRTRSKVLKAKVCEVLGYPIPDSFKNVAQRKQNVPQAEERSGRCGYALLCDDFCPHFCNQLPWPWTAEAFSEKS
jgi:hypothetical protein